ncbi:MAG: hypothetical protein L0H77_08380, partial [Bifidobacterium mongoliense]|nr:hypothetical protein [Bifidobacterium mongoliense]
VPGHRDLLVVANLSSHTAVIPPETAGLLGFDQTGFPSRSSGTAGISVDDIVLSTYPADHTLASLTTRRLEPWEAFIYRM